MDKEKVIKNIAKNVKVELDEEFDKNFERKAFFDRQWAPLSPYYHPMTGSMLLRTGALRKSIHSRLVGNSSINYYSSLRYAGIHNEGGIIEQNFVPTSKQRRFFFAKYKQTGDEKFRRSAMAKRIHRKIAIPARPFIGDHPKVREAIGEIATEIIAQEIQKEMENNLKQYMK